MIEIVGPKDSVDDVTYVNIGHFVNSVMANYYIYFFYVFPESLFLLDFFFVILWVNVFIVRLRRYNKMKLYMGTS